MEAHHVMEDLPAGDPRDLALAVPSKLIDVIAEEAARRVAARMPAPTIGPYLTVDLAAEYLACKPKRIYDLCAQGRLEYRKDGSRTLLRRVDLDAYVEGSA